MFELLKLILTNKEYIISENGLFNKDTISMLTALIKGKLPKEFKPTKNQEKLLISAFLLSNNTFNENTPNFILENKECILKSIQKDVNSIKYVKIKYLKDPDIFKQLILHGYDYFNHRPEQITLHQLNDPDILDYYLKNYDIYNPQKTDKTFITRINQILNEVLNDSPTIKSFEPTLKFITECKWESYRNENNHKYENIFAKISSYLQNKPFLETIEYDLPFLNKMQEILGTKYSTLYQAIIEYHQIYHSNIPNKLDKLQSSIATISSLSALYVAKSKEQYKKELLKDYLKLLKPYYELKKDHPLVLKKTIEIKQKEKLRILYDQRNITNNQDIINFIENLTTKYSNQIPRNIIEYMIGYFIYNGENNIADFINISIPIRYEEYQRYKLISKLINRLNSGYIKITDYEVLKYHNLIKYDETKKIYVYNGPGFNDNEILEINEYQKYQLVYNNIIKDIMKKTKTIEITDEIDEYTYQEISSSIPFTDKYFIFNRDFALKQFKFKNLLYCCFDKKYNPDSLIQNKSYNMIHNLLIDNSLIWLLLILYNDTYNKNNYIFRTNGIYPAKICGIINDMPNIISLANKLKIDITKLNELMNVYDVSKVADNRQIAILGPHIISKLCTCKDYVYTSNKDVIDMSCDLICAMTKRNKSTVPYVLGNTENYKYSMYDPLDETILLSGIDTHSCFKVAGNNHDFLHYCALNKNGFVIKITDLSDNIIAKASGFRHGNIVYINQLRTIYDKGGNKYSGIYQNETESIIETFKKACIDIVMTSQNNDQETDKIDHVIVTKNYILRNYESNVSDDVFERFDDSFIDNQSEDWENYISNTKNLLESSEDGYFETDFGCYSLISIASILKDRELEEDDIRTKDVKAVYERKRNKILITQNIDSKTLQKINKIKAIKSYFNNTDFKETDIPNDSTVFTGDNWFIICHKGTIIDSCCLDFDEKAKIEFNTTIETINKQNESNKENIKPLVNCIQHNSGCINKSLKRKK